MQQVEQRVRTTSADDHLMRTSPSCRTLVGLLLRALALNLRLSLGLGSVSSGRSELGSFSSSAGFVRRRSTGGRCSTGDLLTAVSESDTVSDSVSELLLCSPSGATEVRGPRRRDATGLSSIAALPSLSVLPDSGGLPSAESVFPSVVLLLEADCPICE
jgi:hypothetical protein